MTTDLDTEALARALWTCGSKEADPWGTLFDSHQEMYRRYADRLIASGVLDEMVAASRAEAWDEGVEAGYEWQQQTNGIPHDPPTNPYVAALTSGDQS